MVTEKFLKILTVIINVWIGGMSMRKYYIDNLRWITILLLIPYHAAMAWNAWGEPNYIYFEGNRTISSIVVFLSPYFMPTMFFLAGISTKFALEKRNIKQYIGERVKKLLIPFLLGTLVFLPPMTFIADKFNNDYTGNLFQHYPVFFTKFTDLTGADGGFSVGHFWFILFLFVISVISVAIITLQKKLISNYQKDIPIWLMCILGLPLPFFSEMLSIGGKSLIEYTYIFLIGYYVFSNENAANKTEKYKWHFLFIGLTASVLNVYLFLWCDTAYPILNTVVKFISEWFMLIALLGIFKAYLNFRSKFTVYMSQRSFAFYILHFIWVVIFQYFMADIFSSNIVLIYIVPVILAYCATLACCEIVIRIPILCFLFGTKPIRQLENKQ